MQAADGRVLHVTRAAEGRIRLMPDRMARRMLLAANLDNKPFILDTEVIQGAMSSATVSYAGAKPNAGVVAAKWAPSTWRHESGEQISVLAGPLLGRWAVVCP